MTAGDNVKENVVMDAPQKTNSWPQTAAYFVALASFGVIVASWGPVLPTIAAQTGTDLGNIGLVFSARATGVFIGSLFGGRIFDRLPGHPLLGGALLVLAALFAVVPLIYQFWLLLVLIFIMGLAAGMIISGSNTLLVWVHPENTGPWINGMNFSNALGSFLAPIFITAFMSATGGIRWAFWLLSVLIGATGVYTLFVKSPGIRQEEGSTETGGRVRFARLLPFALVFLLYVSAEVSFGGWLYTFTISLHPGAAASAGLLTSAFWASIAVGRLLASPLSSRLRPRTILLIDFLGALASLVIILALSASLNALWVGTIGFGLFMASLFPTWMAYTDRRIKVNGRISGILYASTAVGAMSFPLLCGRVFAARGAPALMLVIFSALLAAAIIYASVRIFFNRKNEHNT